VCQDRSEPLNAGQAIVFGSLQPDNWLGEPGWTGEARNRVPPAIVSHWMSEAATAPARVLRLAWRCGGSKSVYVILTSRGVPWLTTVA